MSKQIDGFITWIRTFLDDVYANSSHNHSKSDIIDFPTIPSANTVDSNIKMNGVQSAGNVSTYAKADHVHPTDTSRASTNHSHAQYLTESDIEGIIIREYGTFEQLQTLIDNTPAGGTLELKKNYRNINHYLSDTTNGYGLSITKNITINGNGYIIDGDNYEGIAIIKSDSGFINVTINNCNIINSTLGVFCPRPQNITINDCTFSGHKVSNQGTYEIWGESVTIGAPLFINLSASSSIHVRINNCQFSSNYCTSAGGIYSLDGDTTTITVSNCIFTGNNKIGNQYTNSMNLQNNYDFFDTIYPIGSIYTSTNNIQPITLFGGRWEQIKDKFLLASGTSHSNGSTGGSENAVVVEHNHTQDSHNHGTGDSTYPNFMATNINIAVGQTKRVLPSTGSNYYYVYSTEKGDITQHSTTNSKQPAIDNKGESGVGKNMPPYLTVNVWKRIA